jgi:hypothetical protein
MTSYRESSSHLDPPLCEEPVRHQNPIFSDELIRFFKYVGNEINSFSEELREARYTDDVAKSRTIINLFITSLAQSAITMQDILEEVQEIDNDNEKWKHILNARTDRHYEIQATNRDHNQEVKDLLNEILNDSPILNMLTANMQDLIARIDDRKAAKNVHRE